MVGKLKKICGLICLAAILWMNPVSVQAAGKTNGGCLVRLPVYVSLEEKDTEEEFEFILVPDRTGTPMPETDTIRITVKNGIGSGQFGGISYQIPGEYQYHISQIAGNSEGMEYDSSTYAVMIRVVNDEKGGLTSEIWAVRDSEAVKTDRLSFTNRIVPEASQTPKPTATDRPHVSRTDKTVVSHSVKTVHSPKTGDTAPLEILAGILVLAAVTVSVILILIKKRKRS